MADKSTKHEDQPENGGPGDAADGPKPPKRRMCGTMPVHQRLLQRDPAYARARIASENNHRMFAKGYRTQMRTGVTSIPVVVHVLYKTAAQNISDAQVRSQIEVLNRDFRKTNPDVSSAPPAFAPSAADSRVVFALATTAPDGSATTGITRTSTTHASFADDDSAKATASGGIDPWPADKYLNIWTVPRLTSSVGDLLGYAQFPGGPAATDGVVILHSAFGTSGTATAPFHLGRTTTHEVGHWLNLRHIWGDDGNGCNGSDFVDDTPNQAGPNFGAPVFPHVTCDNGPSGDMFMNFMDYVDDASMVMFTGGQVLRMQAALDGDRSTIGAPLPGGTPTLKFVDDPGTPTLKFSDDPSLKFSDDPGGPTLKFSDDPGGPTLKFLDDPGPSLKFLDDPSLKFSDDLGPSLKFRDDTGPSLKFRDDPSLKFADDGGSLKFRDDGGPLPGPGPDPGPFGRGLGTAGQPTTPSAAPFVLSTPHHSMAWVHSFPGAAQAALTAATERLQHYQSLLETYSQAEAAGQLSPVDREQADVLYRDYLSLVAEYQQFVGG